MAEEAVQKRREMFTKWFNVDRPWTLSQNPLYGPGDYETVANIKNHFTTICEDMYEIAGAECRLRGREDEVFSESNPIDTGDVLSTYCTKRGLVCRAEDQVPGRMCGDYSVRFLCKYTGQVPEDPHQNLFPEFDARIYLVLAIVPVIIFLIRLAWAYLFRRRRRQRRRQRREQRRRRGEARDGEEEDEDDSDNRSVNSDLARPPPSYQELFSGSGGSPSVFAISGSALTACAKCKDAQCSVVKANQGGQIAAQSTGTSNSTSPGESSAPSQREPHQPAGDIPLENLGSPDGNSSVVQVENETNEGSSNQTENQSHQPNNQTTELNNANTSANVATDATVTLTIPTDPGIPADVPSPCACACHRASPFGGRGVAGYDNPVFSTESDTASPSNSGGNHPYRGRHIPALPRPVSSVSIVSQITLSELPSYEDALKLEKKFAAAKDAST